MAGRADRAKQFMPFAALKGYYELILEKEAEKQPRRTLSEEDSAVLSDKLKRLEKGQYVRVNYYNGRVYTTLSGKVTVVDYTYRAVRIGEKRIWFDDITDISEYTPEGRETWVI